MKWFLIGINGKNINTEQNEIHSCQVFTHSLSKTNRIRQDPVRPQLFFLIIQASFSGQI